MEERQVSRRRLTVGAKTNALFKYVTAEAAKAILENGKLRWSSPSQFNDPFDVQFDLHVEFDETRIVELIVDELWRLYSGQKKLEPANSLGKVFAAFLSSAPGLSRTEHI